MCKFLLMGKFLLMVHGAGPQAPGPGAAWGGAGLGVGGGGPRDSCYIKKHYPECPNITKPLKKTTVGLEIKKYDKKIRGKPRKFAPPLRHYKILLRV